MGRVEESLAASRLVLTMDPLHLLMNAHLGWHYFMADQPDPAVEQCDRLLRLERAFPWGHYFKGCALALRGDAVSSVDSFREALDLSGTPVMLAGLGYALAVNQESGPALEIAANLERQAAGLGLFAFEIGLIHFALHDLDRAFQYFRKAREELSGWSLYLPVDPRLKSLRSDPRFAELASGITQL
jgi:tetratricopeptide (TPR) repeat protein